jgi:hypothetical protein
MKKTDYSVSMMKAQTASLPFALFAVAEAAVFFAVWGSGPVTAASDFMMPWYFFPIFIIGIVVHELIHAFSWMAAGTAVRFQMKFGFQVKTLTPYAHCIVPIKKSAYVFGTLMPAVVLGFIPFAYALYSGNGWVLIFAVLFTFAAVGDFLIVWLIRAVSWNAMVEDHNENAGCFVYE